MLNRDHNPDVLTCLANLSNDEVFTPPSVVNEMLDLLPKAIWGDKNVRFLDPFCKSGVFLREITKRLNSGLKKEIPDEQKRINHILSSQVYGIAITELTALLSRRSVYCAKAANSKYSITNSFQKEDGNIFFTKTKHSWSDGSCTFCGVSRHANERDESQETYAYGFIHTNNPEKIFNMKFDVIVGNPPYQMSDGGGRDSGAIPLYHRFIEQAIKMSPRYISMIVPARWYSGGKGLDQFRSEMLGDKRIAQLHDFPETSDCFPGLNIRGGVCYFLWDSEHKGECNVYNHKNGKVLSVLKRGLLEHGADVFVRYNPAISILQKVRALNEESFMNIVSSRKPFGIDSNFENFKLKPDSLNNIKLFRFGDTGYVSESSVLKNHNWVNEIKVLVSKASPGGDEFPHQIITAPIIAPKMSCCTETYLLVGPFNNNKTASNVVAYMKTSFFRFMMSLIKNTQNISKGCFAFVPVQDFSDSWSDERLYSKYKLTNDEIAFIDTLIRPFKVNENE